MHKFLTRFAVAMVAFAVPAIAGAQELVVANAEQRMAAALDAQARANMIYAYDQAAWHATDRFFEDTGAADAAGLAERFPGISGYVVVPSETPGTLDALFVAVQENGPVEVARFGVEGGEVVSSEILPLGSEKSLSPLAMRLFDARLAAQQEAASKGASPCTPSPFNTVVLPPDDDGEVEAYLLSPQIDVGKYPLGGHFRVAIAENGSIREFRELVEGCQLIEWDPEDEDIRMNAFIAPHLLDPQPNEAHLFVSHYVPFSMGIVTGDAIWLIIGGGVTDPVAIDPETGELP